MLDLPSQESDLLAGHINAALLYAHLAALKAGQLAQAGQCVGSLVVPVAIIGNSSAHVMVFRLKLNPGVATMCGKAIRAACLVAFQKSGQYALDGAEGATPGSSA